MNERTALLQAVLTNPEENTPRLMFADWLDENGESERAAFIRFQIELALIRAENKSKMRVKNFLRRVANLRQVETFRAKVGEWVASGFTVKGQVDTSAGYQSFWGHPTSGWFRSHWSRGFVERLSVRERIGKVVQAVIIENPINRVEWQPENLASFRFSPFKIPAHVHLFVLEIIPWQSGFFTTVTPNNALAITNQVSVTDQTAVVVRLTSTANIEREATRVFESAYPGVRVLRPGDDDWYRL